MAFRKWNLLKLTKASEDETWTLDFLSKLGAIGTTFQCLKCNGEMRKSGKWWICNGNFINKHKKREKCNSKLSITKGTWFSNCKLNMQQVLQVTYMILNNYEQALIAHEVEMNKNTISSWMNHVRQVLIEWSLKTSVKIGGPGKIVEIDESKFGKRKYNRGHAVEGQWIFGGFERDSGNLFMVPVETRDRETLTKIIQEWIEPGTTIISDMWKAYANLGNEGYQHLTVNHSIEFVNSDSGAHTNGIEGSWRHAKNFIPEYSRKKKSYSGYLAHFMFKKKCKKENLDELETFLKECGEIKFDMHLHDRDNAETEDNNESD